MKAGRISPLIVSVTLCLGSGAFAQGGPGQGGGPGGGGRMYNPQTVETVSGQVLSVEQVRGRGGGGGSGVHLMLKTDKEEIAVHLGPSWYLDKQGLEIVVGDRIEVRGSRITFAGKPAIIAAAVKKGDQSLKLRDDNGLPAWRGQGRRAP
jgi:hypothetical protein